MEKPAFPHLEYLTPEHILSQSSGSLVFLEELSGSKVAVKKRHISNTKAPTKFDENCTKAKIAAEVKLLDFARKSGVNTPRVLEFSLEEGHIKMEYLEKFTTAERHFLAQERSTQDWENFFHCLGQVVGLLHNAGIMHGDLSSTNVMVPAEGPITRSSIYLIGFGLSMTSDDEEDKVADLLMVTKTYPLVIPYLDHFREGYLSTGKNVQGLLQEFTRVSERNYFPPQKPKVKKASFQLPDAHAK